MKTADEILKESMVIDAHLDLMSDLERKHAMGRQHVIKEDYLESFRAGCVDVIFAAILLIQIKAFITRSRYLYL